MLLDPDRFADTNSFEWLVKSSSDLISSSLRSDLVGRVAVVSSFGSESAVLLHLTAQIDRSIPVLFIDSRMMFEETLQYQVDLANWLGLRDIRVISAEDNDIKRDDPTGELNRTNPDRCCFTRKVKPLQLALREFDAWINGRKRAQAASRSNIRPVEAEAGGRLKINPLLYWETEDIKRYFERFDLPRHPLEKHGFTSIGCRPCTSRPDDPLDPRSGRWQGKEKTECGIHLS